MQIGEFLVKIGAVTDTKNIDKFESTLKTTLKTVVAVGTAFSAATGVATYFIDSNIRKIGELVTARGSLYNVTEKELSQARDYAISMQRTGDAIQSVKTAIAFAFLPYVKNASDSLRSFLESNKSAIKDGIDKFASKVIYLSTRIAKTIIDIKKIIGETIGFKKALLAVGIVLAYLNRSMLKSPTAVLIAGIAAVIALVDDYKTAMRGGDSLFSAEQWTKALAVMKGMLPVLKGIIAYMAAYKIAVTSITTAAKILLVTKKTIGAVTKVIAVSTTLWSKGIGLVSKALVFARGAALAFSIAISANPIGAIVAGFVALGAVVFALYKYFKPFRDSVDYAWEKIKKFGKWLGFGDVSISKESASTQTLKVENAINKNRAITPPSKAIKPISTSNSNQQIYNGGTANTTINVHTTGDRQSAKKVGQIYEREVSSANINLQGGYAI